MPLRVNRAKKRFRKRLLRPMPYSSRAAPNCAPMPEPKFATSRVNPICRTRSPRSAGNKSKSRINVGKWLEAGQISCAGVNLKRQKKFRSPHKSTPWPAKCSAADFLLLPKAWRFRRNQCTSTPQWKCRRTPLWCSTARDHKKDEEKIGIVMGMSKYVMRCRHEK